MKFISLCIIIYFIFSGIDLYAIQKEFEFKKISFRYRPISAEKTTIVGLDATKLRRLGKTQEWGMVEAIYKSYPKWTDNVEVKYYILMKGESPKKPIMLAGSVVYMDVEKGEEHIANIYIPPQVIKRYGEVLKIRAELWYNGVLQDGVQWPRATSKIPWWTRVKPIYGSLYNRYYTPFEHEAQAVEEIIKM